MARELTGDKAITEQLQKSTDKCPFCDSTELTASNYDGCHGEMTCDVECNGCGAEWTEGYQFKWASVKTQPEEDGDVIDERIALIDRLRLEGKSEAEITAAVSAFDQANPTGMDEEDVAGMMDPSPDRQNLCSSCGRYVSDDDYVRYFDKCKGCAEDPDT